MGTEIERKFLMASEAWRGLASGERFQQGYLSTDPARTVRVRLTGSQARLTIKGRTVGASRPEFEYDIPEDDARQLLALCLPPLIDKTRYRIPHGEHIWEVDEFHGVNAGLVIAEVELEDEAEAVALPEWIGEEVTGQRDYYNANLISRPYSTWSAEERGGQVG
jgi:adenylate cyclase